MHVHVGILDQDPVRLITPIFDSRSECNHMVFIGAPHAKPMYDRLKGILTEHKVTAEFFEVDFETDISAINERLQTLAKRLKQEAEIIKFNASCGLRHLLLTTYEVFRSYEWPIFVVEPQTDRLCWLYPMELDERQLQDHLNIQNYLAIFGARCEFPEQDIPQHLDDKLHQLGQRWASHALELGPGLATLNYLATTCRKEQVLDVALTEKQQGYKELAELISDLVETKIASYKDGVLTFKSEDARRFANGLWLENLVHSTLRKIQSQLPTIQDHSLNVQVYRDHEGREVRNELDVAAVVNNKLHIIECKTKGMRDDGDDTLYKLESLRDLLGGLQARAMLVSFRPLRYNDLSRAADLGLAIIGPDELKDLHQHLSHWLLDAGGLK